MSEFIFRRFYVFLLLLLVCFCPSYATLIATNKKLHRTHFHPWIFSKKSWKESKFSVSASFNLMSFEFGCFFRPEKIEFILFSWQHETMKSEYRFPVSATSLKCSFFLQFDRHRWHSDEKYSDFAPHEYIIEQWTCEKMVKKENMKKNITQRWR